MNKFLKKFWLLSLFLLCSLSCGHTDVSQKKPGATRIARWQGDKKAAFLLMFDDGWPSHWQVAVPELKKRDMIATFYIVPAKGEYKQFESKWTGEALQSGMVFGNHTMTHDGLQSLDDAEREFGDCTRYILDKVPGKNPRLISFGMPGVKDWNITKQDYRNLLEKNHLIDRPPFQGHGANYHIKTLDEMLGLADKAITAGGMEYLVFHGVERIEPKWGWQDMWDVKQTVFLPFLDGLQERRDRGELWITDHISAHQYETERNTAKVTVVNADTKEIRLEVTSEASPEFYDLPLTLVTKVPTTWKRCAVKQGEKASELEVKNGDVMFEAVPGPQTITVQAAGGTAAAATGVQTTQKIAKTNGVVCEQS